MSGNAEAEVSLPVKLYIYDLTQGMAKGAALVLTAFGSDPPRRSSRQLP